MGNEGCTEKKHKGKAKPCESEGPTRCSKKVCDKCSNKDDKGNSLCPVCYNFWTIKSMKTELKKEEVKAVPSSFTEKGKLKIDKK
jgi:hypothetical protein